MSVLTTGVARVSVTVVPLTTTEFTPRALPLTEAAYAPVAGVDAASSGSL